MFHFDVVITTYNRAESLIQLVSQINGCTMTPEKIIIVDSSDELNELVGKQPNVIYLHSSHKNQPYQRYLGYLASLSEFIVFLDDDIKIVNNQIFNITLDRYKDPTIVGSNVNFIQEGEITVQKEISKQRKPDRNSNLARFCWWFTGVPSIRQGKVWMVGLKGKDDTNMFTESFGGPGSLSFRREIIPSLFDELLFSIFEKKMAMGEDKYISMGALKFGRLAYNNTACIIHPANDSTYFHGMSSFVRKELYSRLFLSLRYVQVKNEWIIGAYLHFYWYAFWRVAISGVNCILNPGGNSLSQLKGKLLGLWDSLTKPLKSDYLCPKINWEFELQKDLKAL